MRSAHRHIYQWLFFCFYFDSESEQSALIQIYFPQKEQGNIKPSLTLVPFTKLKSSLKNDIIPVFLIIICPRGSFNIISPNPL